MNRDRREEPYLTIPNSPEDNLGPEQGLGAPDPTRGMPSAEPGPEAAAAEAVIAELTERANNLKDQLLRAHAETENTRRRLEQQAEDRGRYAVSNFAKDMLQVADNLRRALEAAPGDLLKKDPLAKSLAEGVELTEKALLSALDRHGIKRIEAKGKRFDPHFHQAMMEVDDASQPPGTVVMEIQAGYTIGDRLLRPALVGVSKSKPGDAGVDTSV